MKCVLAPTVASLLFMLACGPQWARKSVDAASMDEETDGAPASSGGTGGSRSGGTGGSRSGGTGGFGGSPVGTGGSSRSDAARPVDGPAGTGGAPASGQDAASAAEPCAPAKDVSCAGGNGITDIAPPKACFRTADIITHWGCGNPSGWSVKLNGKPIRCGDSALSLDFLPVNGLLYFELTGDEKATPTNVWWQGMCKPGPYPPWPGTGGGGTTGPQDASSG